MIWFFHLLISVTLCLFCTEFIAYEATQNLFSYTAWISSSISVGCLIWVRGSGITFDWDEVKNIWLYWGGSVFSLGVVYVWPIIRKLVEVGHA